MIHGMWGGGWYWQNYVKYFQNKGYRCITPTLRYHDMDQNKAPDSRLGTVNGPTTCDTKQVMFLPFCSISNANLVSFQL